MIYFKLFMNGGNLLKIGCGVGGPVITLQGQNAQTHADLQKFISDQFSSHLS